jgi:drug/metabolite transporter (DMT)-like permease
VPLSIVLLVLAAALMHAAWNALVKTSRDVSLDTALVACTAALLALTLLPFLPLPAPASWPFLAISFAVQLAYYRLLAAAYRHGDLSYAYPLMRGMAPPLVAGAGAFILNDPASPWLWTGVALVSTGVIMIGGWRLISARVPSRATRFALANAAVIAAYTLVDGIGVRQSGNAMSYGLWLFFLIGVPIVPLVLWRRGRVLAAHLRSQWPRSLLSGSLSVVVYLIALWAMTQAPIAAVAALRETSVIFAALIGAVWLKEPFGRQRIAGACVVAVGIALLKS